MHLRNQPRKRESNSESLAAAETLPLSYPQVHCNALHFGNKRTDSCFADQRQIWFKQLSAWKLQRAITLLLKFCVFCVASFSSKIS